MFINEATQHRLAANATSTVNCNDEDTSTPLLLLAKPVLIKTSHLLPVFFNSSIHCPSVYHRTLPLSHLLIYLSGFVDIKLISYPPLPNKSDTNSVAIIPLAPVIATVFIHSTLFYQYSQNLFLRIICRYILIYHQLHMNSVFIYIWAERYLRNVYRRIQEAIALAVLNLETVGDSSYRFNGISNAS